jgi:hypothetical protein
MQLRGGAQHRGEEKERSGEARKGRGLLCPSLEKERMKKPRR